TVTNCEEYTFSPGFAIFGGIRIAACSYIYYYFCQFQVISVTIVGFSFFNGRVPTISSMSVYTPTLHTHTHTHTHIYIHTHTHTHTYTVYIHTHSCLAQMKSFSVTP